MEYDTMTHHTNLDYYERLQPGDMQKMATIAAGFAYFAANRDEKLPRKPLTVPVVGRTDEVGARRSAQDSPVRGSPVVTGLGTRVRHDPAGSGLLRSSCLWSSVLAFCY
ncbi:MAG: hypothetical protein MZW92_24925 [Comamonadaceae bacterium]|nr:hypothetical protein [Comamonadaceae bacterium]